MQRSFKEHRELTKGEQMEHNRILDIIISLLIGIKNSNKLIDLSSTGGELRLNGCSYLLNQTIRQYQLSQDHYHVSEKAQKLWDSISTDSIFNYTYRDKVTKDVEGEVVIEKFRGGEGKSYATTTIKCGDYFVFKDVFTDEHIVTVSNIIGELLNLPEYNYEAIENVLNKIHVCKMLKSEDRSIKRKRNRSTDYREVVVSVYKDAGIKLLNFDYQTIPETSIGERKTELGDLSHTAPSATKMTPKRSYAKNGIGEWFLFTNEKTSGYGIKTAYRAYNARCEEVGFVFMTYDKRSPSYGCAELRFHKPYKGKIWYRFTTNRQKISWDTLCMILNEAGKHKVYID